MSKFKELMISHDCTYRVEMHSKPYPYSDPLYTGQFIIKFMHIFITSTRERCCNKNMQLTNSLFFSNH